MPRRSAKLLVACIVLVAWTAAFGAVLSKGVVDPPLDDLGRPQLFFGAFEAY